MDDQRAVNEAAALAVRDFLGGPSPRGDDWTFELGEHLASNWGAVYGGATAAAAVALGRLGAPDRAPRGLHLQMVRSLPFGPAVGIARVRHSGRVVTTIEVELYDAREKLAAVGLLTAVLPDALAQGYSNSDAVPFEMRKEPSPWDLETNGELAPIGDVLQLDPCRIVATNVPGSVTGDAANCVVMKPPWADTVTTGPELACLVADTVNGAPLWHGQSTLGVVVFPNTDLTLRFASPTGADPVLAAGRLVAVEQGTTTVAIDVQAGGHWLAHGHSTSVLIPTPDPAASRVEV